MNALKLRWMLPALAVLAMAGCASPGASSGKTANDSGDRQVNSKEAAAALADLGAVYLQRQQYPDAKENLDRALEYDSSNFVANWSMASLMEQIDKPADAERYYKVALRLQPENPELANTYATYLCKSGKVDEALKLFDGLARNKLYRTPWAAATNAAVCLRADKRNADALAYAERALTMRPDYVDAVIQKADLQLVLGKGAGSIQTIDGYLATPIPKERDPRRPDLLLIGVRAGLAVGDRAAAEGYRRQLIRDFPKSPQATEAVQLLQGAK
jgi:type IV pilus assembly protein PilF